MFTINLLILLIFLIGFLFCLKNSQDLIKNVDKKEHKLYILYPLSDKLLRMTGLGKILKQKSNVTDSIKALYITTKPELLQRLYWCKRISLVIVVVVLFNVLSLLGQLTSHNSSIIKDGKYLLRPKFGQGSKEVQLNVTMDQEDMEASDHEDLSETQEISINIEERSYTEEELKDIFARAFQYLKSVVLGGNQSAELIYGNLNFIGGIPGTGITVEWQPQDYTIIQSDGTVNNQSISAEGVSSSVTVILRYQRQRKEYSMSFQIFPQQPNQEALLRKDLEQEINSYSEKSAKEDYLELPGTLGNYRLNWKDTDNKNNSVTFLFLGVIMSFAVWLLADKELEKQMKKRKEQMLFDYPEIINKFTLLVNAGMTVKQAWNKIAEDYNMKFTQKKGKKRFAYEEMLITVNELKLGQPENSAYEQYGRRIGLIPYIKFSSLISQNLKKGNKGFTDLLMTEAVESFEERKEVAKRLGEEAGTKLLIPMMLMLIIVLLIIMIPAFWSFKV